MVKNQQQQQLQQQKKFFFKRHNFQCPLRWISGNWLLAPPQVRHCSHFFPLSALAPRPTSQGDSAFSVFSMFRIAIHICIGPNHDRQFQHVQIVYHCSPNCYTLWYLNHSLSLSLSFTLICPLCLIFFYLSFPRHTCFSG